MKNNGNIIIEDNNINKDYWKAVNLTFSLDKRLSWKAKGIFVYLSTRPNGWRMNQNDLINKSKDNIDSLRSGIKELEDLGYLRRRKTRNKDNKIQWIYTICRNPKDE